ncbi:hypothetical protein [Anabaena azotica]|uniref:hypothetical protein n=1 Tax=Anabaena azotica TaxID=197653 RepID=UPI0039A52C19
MNSKEFQYWVAYLLDLMLDLKNAENLFNNKDDNFSRRTYIRTLFATIDGTLYLLKQIVLIETLDKPNVLQESDNHFLKKTNIGQKENFKSTIGIVEKTFDIQLDIETHKHNEEWRDFLTAINIRNTVTHPKRKEEFVITDDNIQLIIRVSKWYIYLICRALDAIDLVKKISKNI